MMAWLFTVPPYIPLPKMLSACFCKRVTAAVSSSPPPCCMGVSGAAGAPPCAPACGGAPACAGATCLAPFCVPDPHGAWGPPCGSAVAACTSGADPSPQSHFTAEPTALPAGELAICDPIPPRVLLSPSKSWLSLPPGDCMEFPGSPATEEEPPRLCQNLSHPLSAIASGVFGFIIFVSCSGVTGTGCTGPVSLSSRPGALMPTPGTGGASGGSGGRGWPTPEVSITPGIIGRGG